MRQWTIILSFSPSLRCHLIFGFLWRSNQEEERREKKMAPNSSSNNKSEVQQQQHQLTDFIWEGTDEPHFSRRHAILKKYPQIKDLYGVDRNTKYVVTAVVITQLVLAYYMQYLSWPAVVLIGWSLGGFANQFLNLAVHEITHNLAFDKPLHNRLYAVCVANLPLGIPSAM